MKFLNTTLFVILIAVLIAFASLWGAKTYVEANAEEKVAAYIEKSREYTDLNAQLMNAALYVYEEFGQQDVEGAESPLGQFENILTSPALPGFLKTSPGAFAVSNPQSGPDGNAAKILQFVLALQGIDSHEWEIISPKNTRTGLVVKDKDQTFKYLDPAAGVIAMYENQVLLGPYAARFLVSNGDDYQKIFVKLAESSDVSFYEDFAHVMMAPPSFPVYVNVAAPVYDEPIVLGELNGDAKDVAQASSQLDLTPYMDYLGQKHKAHVQRTLYFTHPAKITFVLTDDFDPSSLKANITPEVDGKKLVFKVPEDEPLILDDGKSALSFMNKNKYVPVDQIIIEHL